ncbi:MAG TPA: hypothetical protein PLO78_08795 [Candidatus Omnitrophota bacterium]|nr:hypothetical protein [Candidatus Omnitrophota bacterium]
MESRIGWFLLGIVAAVGTGLGILSGFLFIQNRRMKRRFCELMHDKGALTAQVSILEDALKAKESYDQK